MSRFIFLLLVLSCTLQLHAQTKRVLFLGNSYTQVNNLPLTFSNLALSGGDTVYTDMNAPGGYTFQGHSTNVTSLAKIAQGNWDFVVLQEQSQMPSFPPAQVESDTYPYAHMLDSLIHVADSCAETVFYMTWGRKYGDQSNCAFYPILCTFDGMQSRLRYSYVEMGDLNHASVAPAGEAWKRCRDLDSTINLYQADNSHPSVEGTYLTACVFYSTLFQKSPVGLTYTSGLSTPVASFLQQVAYDVVFDSLDTWNVAIDHPHPAFTISQLNATSIELNNQSTDADSYLWIINGNTYYGSPLVHDFGTIGTYTVIQQVSNSCFTDTLSFTINLTTVGINDDSRDEIQIYPNPSDGLVYITGAANSIANLYDLNGRLLKSEKINTELHFEEMPASVYILEIVTPNGRIRKKLIRE